MATTQGNPSTVGLPPLAMLINGVLYQEWYVRSTTLASKMTVSTFSSAADQRGSGTPLMCEMLVKARGHESCLRRLRCAALL